MCTIMRFYVHFSINAIFLLPILYRYTLPPRLLLSNFNN